MGQTSASTKSAKRPLRRRRPGTTVGVWVVVSLAGLLWWGWPTLSGADDDPPVIVVLENSLADAAPVFDKAIRERGRRARVVVLEGAWCAGPPALTSQEATLRVVVADPEPGCDPWSQIPEASNWRWIAPSGLPPDRPAPDWVAGVDLTWSLGDGGVLRRACEWWDVCEADGQIAVRSEPGVLTFAGAVRVARTIAVLR